MTDSDHTRQNGPDDGPELDRLVLRAVRDRREPYTRPSHEAILAYLDGRADDAQREQVQHALLISEEFRCELVALREDLERLDGRDMGARFDQIPVEAVPSERQELAAAERTGRASDLARIRRRSWWRWSLIPASAVALLLIWMILSSGPSDRRPQPEKAWELAIRAVPHSTFEPIVLRGPVEPDPFYRPADAALEALHQRLNWRSGRLHIASPPAAAGTEPHPASVRPIHLELVGPDRIVRPVAAAIPVTADDLQAWLLTLASLDLYSLRIMADTVRVGIPRDAGGAVAVTLTYRVRGGFLATEPAIVVPDTADPQ